MDENSWIVRKGYTKYQELVKSNKCSSAGEDFSLKNLS